MEFMSFFLLALCYHLFILSYIHCTFGVSYCFNILGLEKCTKVIIKEMKLLSKHSLV